jgi:hypothetical protein
MYLNRYSTSCQKGRTAHFCHSNGIRRHAVLPGQPGAPIGRSRSFRPGTSSRDLGSSSLRVAVRSLSELATGPSLINLGVPSMISRPAFLFLAAAVLPAAALAVLAGPAASASATFAPQEAAAAATASGAHVISAVAASSARKHRLRVYQAGSCSGSGSPASCSVTGLAARPRAIRLHVSSTYPGQHALVTWSMICTRGRKRAGQAGSYVTTTGSSQLIGTSVRRPASCSVKADAQLTGTSQAVIRVWATYTRRPSR